MRTFTLLLLAGLASQSIFAHSAMAAQKALIYKGTGSCSEDCSEAFWNLAKDAGFDPVYVGPEAPKADTFTDAAVWIQPGGYASTAMKAMSTQLKTAIKTFVQNGGGYVGYCAGAFVATAKVGTTSTSGLGIFPGNTQLYGSGIDLKKVTWNGSTRYLYWEGGPFLKNLPNTVEKIATYSNGAVGTARTAYGKGRVFITGLHPESPKWWKDDARMNDIDGDDFDLVAEMLHWVTEAH
jgi:glutamine amidotransferase-like uncharacterized protein